MSPFRPCLRERRFASRLRALVLGAVIALVAPAAPARAGAAEAPGAGAAAPGRPPIALILPFVNGSGDPAADWIGAALQDMLNVDLWYVGGLHTWDLPNMVGQTQQPPAALAVEDPAEVQKLTAKLGTDVVIAGRYRLAGDQITPRARLIRPAPAGAPLERSATGPVAGLTELASRLALALLDAAQIPVSADEKDRIEIPKTKSLDALRANGLGFEAYTRYGIKHDEATLKASIRLFEEAVKADPSYAEALNNLAWAQFVAGDHAPAIQNFERAVSLRVDLIDALIGLGKTKLAANPRDVSALPPLEAAVRLNPSLAGHRLELAEALEALGGVPRAQRELEAAERIVADRIPYMEASIHLRQAGLLLAKGDMDAAAARFRRAREAFRVSGSKAGEVGSLRALGDLAAERRDFTAARGYYGEALTLIKQLGDRRGEGMLQNSMGMAALHGGDRAAAERFFTDGLQIYRDAGDKGGQILGLFNLGSVVAAGGDLSRAQQLLLEALLLARQVGDQRAEEAVQERLKQIRGAMEKEDGT
jgi:tetratricopeptide (TPR) repeat protein